MQSTINQCLFKRQNSDNTLYIVAYVDDLLIAGKKSRVINNLTEELQKEYEVKNMAPVKYYLGINIKKT